MQQKTPPCDGDSEDEDSSESDEETGEEEFEDTAGPGEFSEAVIGADHEEEESEDYVKFLEATEKHRRARDKDVKVYNLALLSSLLATVQVSYGSRAPEDKFDFRTDSITDAVLVPGLAAIEQDFERTKREMGRLYGEMALRVHSRETKVGRGLGRL